MAVSNELGDATLRPSSVRSHSWTRMMNENMVRASMGAHPSVEGMGELPASATEGQMWIDSVTKKLCMWIDGLDDYAGHEADSDYEEPIGPGWWAYVPTIGHFVYRKDVEQYWIFNWSGEWELALDLNAVHRGVEREFACYIPGQIRPSAIIWHYVAGLELTVEANAPHSGAILEVPPSQTIVFSFNKAGATITFAAGSTDGVIYWPTEEIIQPSHTENMFVRAHELTLSSPADLHGAQGLTFTLRGKIRPID